MNEVPRSFGPSGFHSFMISITQQQRKEGTATRTPDPKVTIDSPILFPRSITQAEALHKGIDLSAEEGP